MRTLVSLSSNTPSRTLGLGGGGEGSRGNPPGLCPCYISISNTAPEVRANHERLFVESPQQVSREGKGQQGLRSTRVGMTDGPAARRRPEPVSSRCHLLGRTGQAEGSGGPRPALPEVKRPLRAPARRTSRPVSKVSMGSPPPPQPSGPGTPSVSNRAELGVQGNPGRAELRAPPVPSAPHDPARAARHLPAMPRRGRDPDPLKEPAAVFTSALWSATRSHPCKRIRTHHSCPASVSSHPRPLR